MVSQFEILYRTRQSINKTRQRDTSFLVKKIPQSVLWSFRRSLSVSPPTALHSQLCREGAQSSKNVTVSGVLKVRVLALVCVQLCDKWLLGWISRPALPQLDSREVPRWAQRALPAAQASLIPPGQSRQRMSLTRLC